MASEFIQQTSPTGFQIAGITPLASQVGNFINPIGFDNMLQAQQLSSSIDANNRANSQNALNVQERLLSMSSDMIGSEEDISSNFGLDRRFARPAAALNNVLNMRQDAHSQIFQILADQDRYGYNDPSESIRQINNTISGFRESVLNNPEIRQLQEATAKRNRLNKQIEVALKSNKSLAVNQEALMEVNQQVDEFLNGTTATLPNNERFNPSDFIFDPEAANTALDRAINTAIANSDFERMVKASDVRPDLAGTATGDLMVELTGPTRAQVQGINVEVIRALESDDNLKKALAAQGMTLDDAVTQAINSKVSEHPEIKEGMEFINRALLQEQKSKLAEDRRILQAQQRILEIEAEKNKQLAIEAEKQKNRSTLPDKDPKEAPKPKPGKVDDKEEEKPKTTEDKLKKWESKIIE